MAKTTYAAAGVFLLLMVFLIVYMIMISPSDRAQIMSAEELSGRGNIVLERGEFIPRETRISEGQTVTWINRDGTPHRISGADFQSPLLQHNERFSHTFERKGVYVYTSEMKTSAIGTIIVE